MELPVRAVSGLAYYVRRRCTEAGAGHISVRMTGVFCLLLLEKNGDAAPTAVLLLSVLVVVLLYSKCSFKKNTKKKEDIEDIPAETFNIVVLCARNRFATVAGELDTAILVKSQYLLTI
jgi:hypothetical protein